MLKILLITYHTIPREGLIVSRWDQTCYVFSLFCTSLASTLFCLLLFLLDHRLNPYILGLVLFGCPILVWLFVARNKRIRVWVEKQDSPTNFKEKLLFNSIYFGSLIIMVIMLGVAKQID